MLVMRRRWLRFAATAVALAGAVGTLRGYALYGSRWPNGAIVMHLQLGPGSGTLIDRSTSWNQSF